MGSRMQGTTTVWALKKHHRLSFPFTQELDSRPMWTMLSREVRFWITNQTNRKLIHAVVQPNVSRPIQKTATAQHPSHFAVIVSNSVLLGLRRIVHSRRPYAMRCGLLVQTT